MKNSFQISCIILSSIKRERSYDFSKQLKITSPRQKNRADCEKSSDQGEVKFRPTHPPNLWPADGRTDQQTNWLTNQLTNRPTGQRKDGYALSCSCMEESKIKTCRKKKRQKEREKERKKERKTERKNERKKKRKNERKKERRKNKIKITSACSFSAFKSQIYLLVVVMLMETIV